MKCLPRKTWQFKLSRAPELDGFVLGRFRERGVLAYWLRRARILEVESRHVKRVHALVRRLCATKRGCCVVRKEIVDRDFEIPVPFHYDSSAFMIQTFQRPRFPSMVRFASQFSLRFRGSKQVLHVMECEDREHATELYQKILPILGEFKCSKTDAMRIKRLNEMPFDDLEDYVCRYHREVVRARECDRVLALVPRVGDPAVLWRVGEFLCHT